MQADTDAARLWPIHQIQPMTALATVVYVAAIWHLSYAQARNAKSSDRPNIVYILADNLGYGDLGCYGQKRIQTPCID